MKNTANIPRLATTLALAAMSLVGCDSEIHPDAREGRLRTTHHIDEKTGVKTSYLNHNFNYAHGTYVFKGPGNLILQQGFDTAGAKLKFESTGTLRIIGPLNSEVKAKGDVIVDEIKKGGSIETPGNVTVLGNATGYRADHQRDSIKSGGTITVKGNVTSMSLDTTQDVNITGFVNISSVTGNQGIQANSVAYASTLISRHGDINIQQDFGSISSLWPEEPSGNIATAGGHIKVGGAINGSSVNSPHTVITQCYRLTGPLGQRCPN